MKKLYFAYVGQSEEVMMNFPYRQLFSRGKRIEVTQEMAEVLKTHPEFREITSIKEDNQTEAEKLRNTAPAEKTKYLEGKCDELGWKDFQKWAKSNFGAADTSKKELIQEIIIKSEEVI